MKREANEDKRSDGDLGRALDALPGAIEPSRELWSGVAARIEAERTRVTRVRRTAAAATVFLAAAAALLGIRTSHPTGVPTPIVAEPVARVVAPVAHESAPCPEEARRRAEDASYDTAVAAISGAVDERMGTLPPADAAAIRKSLDAIRQGMAATRESLARQPDDPDLRAALDDEYQQEIQTLNDVLDWTTRS